MRLWRDLVAFGLGLLLGWALAGSTSSTVSYATARLAWNPPTVGIPAVYLVQCGPQSGQYDQPIVTVAAPQTDIVLHTVVGRETAYCVVTAANTAGESGPSNEVHLRCRGQTCTVFD